MYFPLCSRSAVSRGPPPRPDSSHLQVAFPRRQVGSPCDRELYRVTRLPGLQPLPPPQDTPITKANGHTWNPVPPPRVLMSLTGSRDSRVSASRLEHASPSSPAQQTHACAHCPARPHTGTARWAPRHRRRGSAAPGRRQLEIMVLSGPLAL